MIRSIGMYHFLFLYIYFQFEIKSKFKQLKHLDEGCAF